MQISWPKKCLVMALDVQSMYKASVFLAYYSEDSNYFHKEQRLENG